MLEVLRGLLRPEYRILNVGCGTAAKIIPLSGLVSEIVGVEPNPEMRQKAQANIDRAGIGNIKVLQAFADKLPFPDNSFDVVTSMLAPHNSPELARVLRPSGCAVLEKLAEMDKRNLREAFGKDASGWRGYLCELSEGQRAAILEQELRQCFAEVSFRSGTWKTCYSSEGLVLLCRETRMVRDFDEVKDRSVLSAIETKFGSPSGIETYQVRLLFIARSPLGK